MEQQIQRQGKMWVRQGKRFTGEEMPMKDKGEGAREGRESLQTGMQV